MSGFDLIEELKKRNMLLTDQQKEELKAQTLKKQEERKHLWLQKMQEKYGAEGLPEDAG